MPCRHRRGLVQKPTGHEAMQHRLWHYRTTACGWYLARGVDARASRGLACAVQYGYGGTPGSRHNSTQRGTGTVTDPNRQCSTEVAVPAPRRAPPRTPDPRLPPRVYPRGRHRPAGLVGRVRERGAQDVGDDLPEAAGIRDDGHPSAGGQVQTDGAARRHCTLRTHGLAHHVRWIAGHRPELQRTGLRRGYVASGASSTMVGH